MDLEVSPRGVVCRRPHGLSRSLTTSPRCACSVLYTAGCGLLLRVAWEIQSPGLVMLASHLPDTDRCEAVQNPIPRPRDVSFAPVCIGQVRNLGIQGPDRLWEGAEAYGLGVMGGFDSLV